jgi:hypothetical protein
MRRLELMAHLFVSVALTLGTLACGGHEVDRTKFQSVDAMANALRMDLTESEGNGSARFAEMLGRFRAEISALEDRTAGSRERAVLSAFAGVAEEYGHFLRFKRLDADAVGDMVLLTGPNRPLASRYDIPMENRGGGRWVSRKHAMRVFAEQAERKHTTAVSGLPPR